MAGVSESIASEFFEANGFFVRQPTKYVVGARSKRPHEEVDLVITNPSNTQGDFSAPGIWTGADLAKVRSAIVGVCGWHSDRMSPAVLDQSPEIFRFAEERILKGMTEDLGDGPVAKILCIPGFAASENLEHDALCILRDAGVDGVITFRTMLMELARSIDANKNYEKSDVLQMIRIFKNYDLLKDGQLDLFSSRRKK